MAKVWHSMEAAEALKELDTDIHKGLTEDAAKRRIEKYGYNELKKEEGVSPLTIFINQFKNILIIILLIATVLSALVGERVLVEAGDKVPADARLVEAYSLKCDEAPLTGESIPVGKDIRALPEDVPVGDRKNMVLTGTTVTYGRGKAVVTSTGMNTEFGKIAEEVMTVKTEKTPLEKRTEEIGKWLGFTALAICCLVAGVSIAREAAAGTINAQFVIRIVVFAIALAVAAVS